MDNGYVLDFSRSLPITLRLQLPIEIPQFRLKISLVRSRSSSICSLGTLIGEKQKFIPKKKVKNKHEYFAA